MSAVLFGSIGTLADTSELQRAAFNAAFAEHGLDWRWEQEEYAILLAGNGGAQRIADYAAARGEQVDAGAVHATKSQRFQQALAEADLAPRDGVLDVVAGVRDAGHRLALVTTTSPENVAALFASLEPALGRADFDLVLDTQSVEMPKPDPAAYVQALDALGESAGSCVAIEDNVGGVEAAKAAGLTCVAFPGRNNAGHDFGAADERVEHLAPAQLLTHIPAA